MKAWKIAWLVIIVTILNCIVYWIGPVYVDRSAENVSVVETKKTEPPKAEPYVTCEGCGCLVLKENAHQEYVKCSTVTIVTLTSGGDTISVFTNETRDGEIVDFVGWNYGVIFIDEPGVVAKTIELKTEKEFLVGVHYCKRCWKERTL